MAPEVPPEPSLWPLGLPLRCAVLGSCGFHTQGVETVPDDHTFPVCLVGSDSILVRMSDVGGFIIGQPCGRGMDKRCFVHTVLSGGVIMNNHLGTPKRWLAHRQAKCYLDSPCCLGCFLWVGEGGHEWRVGLTMKGFSPESHFGIRVLPVRKRRGGTLLF